MSSEFKYEKGINGSHVHNCWVVRRDGDLAEQMFRNDGGVITAFLNGYAIVPIEQYARLVELASPSNAKLQPVTYSMQSIKDANKDLYNNH